MCTMIAHQAKIAGRGKSGQDWFELREANVSYDHPYDLPLEHALNIDFVNEAAGPGARVAAAGCPRRSSPGGLPLTQSARRMARLRPPRVAAPFMRAITGTSGNRLIP